MLILLFAVCMLTNATLADEADLVGQWEEQDHPGLSHSLQLAEDGRFTLHLDVVLPDDFWEGQGILPEFIKDLDMARLTYTGQWESQDGQMILTADTFAMTINGKGMWGTVMDLVFETFRIKEGLSEEEITGLKAAGEETLREREKEQEAERIGDFNSNNPHNFALEDGGSRLVLEIDEHPLYFYRVGSTPIKAWSWGRVKESSRLGEKWTK